VPTYDFKCKSCENKFTVQVSIKDKAKITCPNCGSKDIQQRFSKVNLGGLSGGNRGSACGTCSGGSCSTCSG